MRETRLYPLSMIDGLMILSIWLQLAVFLLAVWLGDFWLGKGDWCSWRRLDVFNASLGIGDVDLDISKSTWPLPVQ